MDASLISNGLMVVSTVMPTLATACVALRFKLRKSLHQGFSTDDWMALVSLLLLWAMSVNTFVAAGEAGIGTINTDMLTAARVFLKCMWISALPFVGVLVTVKISVLFFYQRIFVTKWFRIAVWVMIGILTAWGIAVFVGQILPADPVKSAWDPEHPHYRFAYNPLGLSVACMSLVFDVTVLLFPVYPITKLQMPLKRKLAVIGTFWLGGFCCVAGAVRVYWVYGSVHLVASSQNINRYEYATNFYIWEVIEPNASLIAACLPTFAPLLNTPFAKTLSVRLRSIFSNRSSEASSLEKSTGRYNNLSDGEASSTEQLKTRSDGVIKKTTEIDVERGPASPSGSGRD